MTCMKEANDYQKMKYRRLTIEELNELEKEFINFLSMNSIPAPDWVKMKANTPAHAEELIDTFSDMVLEKAIQKIELLELRSTNNALFFKCEKEGFTIYSISGKAESGINFQDEKTISKLATGDIDIKDGDLNLTKFEQPYTDEREVEIFKLTEQGALISNSRMLSTLEKINA